jgi:hypothetical protein
MVRNLPLSTSLLAGEKSEATPYNAVLGYAVGDASPTWRWKVAITVPFAVPLAVLLYNLNGILLLAVAPVALAAVASVAKTRAPKPTMLIGPFG